VGTNDNLVCSVVSAKVLADSIHGTRCGLGYRSPGRTCGQLQGDTRLARDNDHDGR
jgi:hypothetical protein